MSTDVTIVIPQFNQLALTRRCLASLQQHHQHLAGRCLVIDDGSNLQQSQPDWSWIEQQARVIRQPHLGLTAAWNRAIAEADSEWVILLNNDTETDGEWVTSLLHPLRSGQHQLAGVQWRRERHLPTPPSDSPRHLRLLAGWCLAFSRTVLQELGGFDPALRLYFSDTDLQWRLMEWSSQALPLACVPNLPLRHLSHGTAHQLPDYRSQWKEDRRRFLAKWSHDVTAAAPPVHMPSVGPASVPQTTEVTSPK